MPALKHLKHEEFAQKVACGEATSSAYAQVYPNVSRSTARHSGSLLNRRTEVQERIAELRGEFVERMKQETFLAYEEKRRYLARVVRARGRNLAAGDEDLIQSVKHDRFGNEVLELPDKLAALRLDNDLAVDGAEAGAQKALEIHVRRL
ncbi:MAG: hypothetical protein ACO1TE_18615 [Prosthecobacter sp.]